MTNREIREWYTREAEGIRVLNEQWKAQGVPAEVRARKAFALRHEARLKARQMMENPDEIRQLQQTDQQLYGNPDGPTFDQVCEDARQHGFSADEVFEELIRKALRTNPAVNEKLLGAPTGTEPETKP